MWADAVLVVTNLLRFPPPPRSWVGPNAQTRRSSKSRSSPGRTAGACTSQRSIPGQVRHRTGGADIDPRLPNSLRWQGLLLARAVARGGAAALTLAGAGLAAGAAHLRRVRTSTPGLCTPTLVLLLLIIVHDVSPVFVRARLRALNRRRSPGPGITGRRRPGNDCSVTPVGWWCDKCSRGSHGRRTSHMNARPAAATPHGLERASRRRCSPRYRVCRRSP